MGLSRRGAGQRKSPCPPFLLAGGVFHGHVPLPHSGHAADPWSHSPWGLEGHQVLSHPPVPLPAVFQGEAVGTGVCREGARPDLGSGNRGPWRREWAGGRNPSRGQHPGPGTVLSPVFFIYCLSQFYEVDIILPFHR